MGLVLNTKIRCNAPDLQQYIKHIEQRAKRPKYIKRVIFKRLDMSKGLKTFFTLQHRDESFAIQNYLSTYRLAPRVFEKTEVDGVYGFITELITMLVTRSLYVPHLKYIEKLKRDCERHGIINTDWSVGNYGWLINEFVLIDVDRCSLDEHYFSEQDLKNFWTIYNEPIP